MPAKISSARSAVKTVLADVARLRNPQLAAVAAAALVALGVNVGTGGPGSVDTVAAVLTLAGAGAATIEQLRAKPAQK